MVSCNMREYRDLSRDKTCRSRNLALKTRDDVRQLTLTVSSSNSATVPREIEETWVNSDTIHRNPAGAHWKIRSLIIDPDKCRNFPNERAQEAMQSRWQIKQSISFQRYDFSPLSTSATPVSSSNIRARFLDEVDNSRPCIFVSKCSARVLPSS